MGSFTSKKIKSNIKTTIGLSDKEFFELKHKLFKMGKNEDKQEYSIEDLNKLTIVKALIDIGYKPQKAVDKVVTMWNKQEEIFDEIIYTANEKKKHLDDIIALIDLYKGYKKIGMTSLPVVISPGMSRYLKKMNDNISEIFKSIKSRNDDKLLEELYNLLFRAIELKKENITVDSIKARSFVNQYEKFMENVFGSGIKKFNVMIGTILNIIPEYKNKIDDMIDGMPDYDRNDGITDYISGLISGVFVKELMQKMYDVTKYIIKEDSIINFNESKNKDKLIIIENIDKYYVALIDAIKEYYPIYDDYDDALALLENSKVSIETGMNNNKLLRKNNDLILYYNMVLIALFILKNYKSPKQDNKLQIISEGEVK